MNVAGYWCFVLIILVIQASDGHSMGRRRRRKLGKVDLQRRTRSHLVTNKTMKSYRTLTGDQLTEFKFTEWIKNPEQFEKAHDWCLEHYGEEGIRWNWDVSEDFEYDVLFFKTEQDLVWFMLNCGVEIEK